MPGNQGSRPKEKEGEGKMAARKFTILDVLSGSVVLKVHSGDPQESLRSFQGVPECSNYFQNNTKMLFASFRLRSFTEI